MIFTVACCHSVKLCAHAARAFQIATVVARKLFLIWGLGLQSPKAKEGHADLGMWWMR